MAVRNKRTAKERAAFPIDEDKKFNLPSGVSADTYSMSRSKLSVILVRYLTLRLRSLYQAFDGDLTMCLVLCEIAMRNTERFYDARNPTSAEPTKEDYLPCNALSISEVTGIPRETVRRKLAKLIKMGWVIKHNRDKYVIGNDLSNLFASFKDAQTFDLLQTANKINTVLKKDNN